MLEQGNLFPYFVAIATTTAFLICTTGKNIPRDAKVYQPPGATAQQVVTDPSPEEATYRIEASVIDLSQGRFVELGDSTTTTRSVTSIVSIPFRADVDDNGSEDAVVIMTRQKDDRTLFYLAAALRKGDQYDGTDSFFLGNDIILGHATFENGSILQEFLERRPGEKIEVKPSVLKTAMVTIQNGGITVSRIVSGSMRNN